MKGNRVQLRRGEVSVARDRPSPEAFHRAVMVDGDGVRHALCSIGL